MPVQAYKGMGQDGALSPQQHAKKKREPKLPF